MFYDNGKGYAWNQGFLKKAKASKILQPDAMSIVKSKGNSPA